MQSRDRIIQRDDSTYVHSIFAAFQTDATVDDGTFDEGDDETYETPATEVKAEDWFPVAS